MKKLIAVILAAMMVVLLAACGGGSKSGDAKYVFLEEEMGTESYAIGFKKGNEDLAKTVTGAVYALVKDGTYDKIGEKYPDIKDYLSLKAEDLADAEIPAKGSGDPNFTFKHGFDLDYPPYSYLKDDGSVGGFDVELCQAVCAYMGWKYESVPFNWEAKDMELNAGSCDCIWSGFTKEGREDKYTWAAPTRTTSRASWSLPTPASPRWPTSPARLSVSRSTPPLRRCSKTPRKSLLTPSANSRPMRPTPSRSTT